MVAATGSRRARSGKLTGAGAGSPGRVRPDAVVGVLPQPDHDLSFLQCVEDLSAEALVAQLAIEALARLALPRRAGCNVLDLRPRLGDPLAIHLRSAFEIISLPGPSVQGRCRSGCGSGCRAGTGRRPAPRSRRCAAPPSARGRPGCVRRSVSGCAGSGRRASASAQSRSSRRGCGGAGAAARTSRRSTTAGCVVCVFARP